MSNSKDTFSGSQSSNNISSNTSNKNVTHTQNLPPKTRSNSAKNSATDDYKYIPRAGDAKSDATQDKRPSSGNIKGV